MMDIYFCEHCGGVMVKTSPHQRYHPECAKVVLREREKLRYKPPTPKVVVKPKNPLAEINQKAREMGMTYGQYIAYRKEDKK